MTEAGYKCIEIAKQNGSWTILDDVEELILPLDLKTAFSNNLAAEAHYMTLSKSMKKVLLQWLVLAKRSETRLRRIKEIVALAEEKKLPKIF